MSKKADDLVFIIQMSETLSQIPCSQAVEDQFNDIPWLTMKSDLEPQAAKIISQFSLSNVVKKVIFSRNTA